MTPQIAVMASGGGTTTEAYIRASMRGDIHSNVGLVIVSRGDAGVFERIAALNQEFGLSINCVLINHITHPAKKGEIVSRGCQTAAEQQAILDILKAGRYKLVALMGYMKRIGPKIIEAYGWSPAYKSIYEASMVNTHPGILPDTKAMFGLNIQQYVLERGLPYAGQTLHLVSAKYDDGPTINEHRVNVEAADDAESLFKKVQDVEKKYLPKDIDAFLESKLAYSQALAQGVI